MKKKISLLILPLLLFVLALPAKAATLPEQVTDPLTENTGNFTSYGGAWEYADNCYTQTDPMISGTSWHYGSYFQYAYEDFTLSFRMKLLATGDSEGYAGVLFRKAKPTDTIDASGYALTLKGYGQLLFQDWTKTSTIFSLPIENPEDWHTYKIEVSGKKIKFYVDDEIRQSISNSAFSSGYISLTTGTASASFADFDITGTPIGEADSIGKIGDGNMDKAAADKVFDERAKISEIETGDEPSWFTTMVSKLNGVQQDSDSIIMSSANVQASNNTLKIVAYVILGIAVVLLTITVIMAITKKGNAKAPLAMILVLAFVITGTMASIQSMKADAKESEELNTDKYEQIFYVSPEGDDSNDGSEKAPFLTLRKAQEAVRNVTAVQNGDIAVVLREGTYELGSKLTFDESDSGRNGYDVVWMSYPGEVAKISGGREITGWTENEGNIWTAQADLSDIDSLYVNDVRANVASSGVEPLELLYYDKENNSVVVQAEDAGPITGGSVLLYQDWETHMIPIEAVDTLEDNDTAVALSFGEKVGSFFYRVTYEDVYSECTKYILQNDKTLLDKPGEYYYDKEAKTLYYIPRANEDMTKASVYAPKFDGLVEVKGSSTSSHVQNIVFKGLVFEYSGFVKKLESDAFIEYQASHYYARDNGTNTPDMDVPTATIQVQNADHIQIERSVIRHSGGNGVNFYHSVSESSLDGCLITDIGATGVMSGVYANGLLPGNLYTPDNPEETAVHNIDITNNVVTWTGRQYKGGCGIANILGYEILIRNNEVAYISYTGISNGWGWSTRDYVVKENTIAYNDIHHVAMSAVDVAGFYNLNSQSGTQIRGNYIHDIQRAGTGRAGAPVFGIYLDEGSNQIIVTDNVSLNNYSNEINFHNTGGSIYSLDNDTLNETTIKNAGVSKAYKSISLRRNADIGNSLVTNVSLGQPKNSVAGEVGMKITTTKDVTVSAIGRFHYTGNAEEHKLTIYDASDGSVVATTTIDMAEGTADENGFKYAMLSKDVKLEKGKSYYVVSSETEGGDAWMDRNCQTICDPAFTIDGGVTCVNGKWNCPAKPGEGYMNGPVNLLFNSK